MALILRTAQAAVRRWYRRDGATGADLFKGGDGGRLGSGGDRRNDVVGDGPGAEPERYENPGVVNGELGGFAEGAKHLRAPARFGVFSVKPVG